MNKNIKIRLVGLILDINYIFKIHPSLSDSMFFPNKSDIFFTRFVSKPIYTTFLSISERFFSVFTTFDNSSSKSLYFLIISVS